MTESRIDTGGHANPEHRKDTDHRPVIAGVSVREEDVETVKGIRFIALLFRGMAALLLLLMILQVVSGLSGAAPVSVGVLFAESVRLIIFAGLLWGIGDLAVLWIKSHYDLRATRILLARIDYMIRKVGEADGKLPPAGSGSAADREH